MWHRLVSYLPYNSQTRQNARLLLIRDFRSLRIHRFSLFFLHYSVTISTFFFFSKLLESIFANRCYIQTSTFLMIFSIESLIQWPKVILQCITPSFFFFFFYLSNNLLFFGFYHNTFLAIICHLQIRSNHFIIVLMQTHSSKFIKFNLSSKTSFIECLRNVSRFGHEGPRFCET